jgi:hypothetical protein
MHSQDLTEADQVLLQLIRLLLCLSGARIKEPSKLHMKVSVFFIYCIYKDNNFISVS